MGFNYLNNLHWREISRDERYYCAELYFHIKNNPKAFVSWLNENAILQFTKEELNAYWEIGFEVCFYRDYIIRFGDENGEKSIKRTQYSQKRTFDLCLFSDRHIVIIEAKAQNGFGTKQNEEFKKDISDILRVLKKKPEDLAVSIIALASSVYYDNISNRRKTLPEFFKGKFSWKNIYESFCKEEIFNQADQTYRK